MASLNQSQDLEHHKRKIEDRQRERSNANNSSTESETSRPRSLNWGSHHDLRSVKLVLESNMAPLESEVKMGDDEEEDCGERVGPSAPSRVLTHVFVPTRTQLFTLPPEGERANLTRRRVVIDETRKPTTALCEFVDADDISKTAMADDEQNGRVSRAAGEEGPEQNGDPKADSGFLERKRRRSSAVPSTSATAAAAATTTLPFSPSSSSLGPENQLFKSTSPFSPMQTHSRSQLSLQLSAAVANRPRPSEPETMDSPTLVVIDPSVEAILNERRPRSPSAPDTPTNSLSQVTPF